MLCTLVPSTVSSKSLRLKELRPSSREHSLTPSEELVPLSFSLCMTNYRPSSHQESPRERENETIILYKYKIKQQYNNIIYNEAIILYEYKYKYNII